MRGMCSLSALVPPSYARSFVFWFASRRRKVKYGRNANRWGLNMSARAITLNTVLIVVVCVLAGCPPTAQTGPAASFSASPTAGDAPLAVQFTDFSSSGSASITSWSWDFGDGGTSTQQSPSHTYASEGTYTVSLTVTTSVDSDTETKTNYITVEGEGEWYDSYDFSSKGVAGYWPLDGHTDDVSGNENHGQFEDSGAALVGAAAARFGSGAADFTSTTDGMSIESRDIGQSHTVAFWVYPETDEGNWRVAYGHQAANRVKFIFMEGNMSECRGEFSVWDHDPIGSINDNMLCLGTPLPLGTWYHVAVVWTPLERRAYVDGTLVGSESWGGETDWTNSLLCGERSDFFGGLFDADWGLGGGMDDIVMFSRALSDEEVAALASDLNSNGQADFWEGEWYDSYDFSSKGVAGYWPLDGHTDDVRARISALRGSLKHVARPKQGTATNGT